MSPKQKMTKKEQIVEEEVENNEEETPVKKTSNKKSKTKKQTSGSKSNKNVSTKEKKERYFKIIDHKTGKTYGRYTGDTPKQAASKAYTKKVQRLKKMGKTPSKRSQIILRESTRGSARKVYAYEAYRQKLPEPQNLDITDKETGITKQIVYHYRNKIRKIPVPTQIIGYNLAKSKVTKKSIKKTTKTEAKANKKSSNTKKAPSAKATAN